MPRPLHGTLAHSLLPGVALLLAPAVTAQLTWTKVTTTNAPPPLVAPAAALALSEQKVVLFGGLEPTGPSAATWVRDPQGWTQLMAAPSPPARSHAAMATVHSQATLFGGRDAAGNALGDAWVWYTIGGWSPLPGGPAAREGAAFTGCVFLGDAVLFGGRDGATVFGDTWLCGSASVWTPLALGVAPPARHRHAMASGSATTARRVVLFGGIDAAGNHLDDTWVLQQPFGGALVWVPMQPATRPSPRAGHTMRSSWHRDRVQLFGGEGPGGVLGDTWEWDGSNWIAISTTGAPAPLADAVLVDAPHPLNVRPWEAMLLGGRDANGAVADQWDVTSTVPATTTMFGSFVPVLWVLLSPEQQRPWLGSTFVFQVQSSTGPLVVPHVIAGFSNTSSALGPLPLDLGPAFANATLLVDPVVVLPVPAAGSTATVAILLPLVPGAIGTHLYLQVIAWLPQTGLPRWAVSRGIDCVLGWR